MMKIKFCSLASGSSGNCQYLETDRTRVLIDAGLSGKKVEDLLTAIKVCPTTIDSILVTHEHRDHIKGVGVLSRRYDIPIYANAGTWSGMWGVIGEIKNKNIKIFETNKFFQLRDLDIYPFGIFHDATEPVGYCLYYKNEKISILTDTGCVNNEIKDNIKGSSIYLIESNHDIKMLKEGKYPWFLKERIMSPHGHLSNEDAGDLIADIVKGKGEKVLLGHLSKENNTPFLAYNTVKRILRGVGIKAQKDISLDLTFREKPSIVYNF